MKLERILPFSKTLLRQHINKDSIVIDATCGNGHDTEFLAQQVPNGKVYAFDIQEVAIQNTSNKTNAFKNVHLIQDSHAKVKQYIQNNKNRQNEATILHMRYLTKVQQQ